MFRPTDRVRLFASLHVSLDININISPKSSSNMKLTSEYIYFFSLTRFQFSTVFCGHSVFFCYLAKVSYQERFSASLELFGCDLTTNARLRNFSTPQIQKSISLYKQCFLSKETTVLIQSTVLYLPLDCKQAEMLQNVRCTSLTREAGGIMMFD